MCDRPVVPSLEDTCVRWIAKNLSLVTSRQSYGTDFKSLTGLIMHRLHFKTTKGMLESFLNVILQLHELRVLDVSSESQKNDVHVSGVDVLCSGQALPHLTHIDFCGNLFGLTLTDVANFIQNHPHLEFAGLAAWPQRHRHELEGIYQLSLKYPHITMLADRGQKPLLAILLRNKDRRQYLQTAFHNIFEETSSREWLDPELLAAVLRVMRLHMSHSDMILAGTAVVYNLTRGEQSAQLPLDLLNRAVNITLTAIEQHQKLLQLLKNCFLTLCSDTVLHRAQFSCKRCCELVFQSLIKYDDVHMKRMGVAIISILAAEVPTSDLRDLSSDRRRLERLLMYVVEKCLLADDVQELLAMQPGPTLQYLHAARCPAVGSPVYDTTLRFTLSALWNLTDECPDACQGFVEVGGLYVYAKVLKNNVAEVASTKTSLLMEPLMEFFLKMLSHPSIQISYFAAGIVSHLACLKDEEWLAANQYHKSTFIKVLGTAVRNWSSPQTEMVAYRSFQPFQSLILHEESRLEIHLWAVWAIHHILTKKASRLLRRATILLDCDFDIRYHRTTDFGQADALSRLISNQQEPEEDTVIAAISIEDDVRRQLSDAACFPRSATHALWKTSKLGGTFKWFLVLDFEATCNKGQPPDPQEIIEFPVLKIDAGTLDVVDTFHRYVRPVFHPKLSDFCTQLTGIIQDMVDRESDFPVVMQDFEKWIQCHFPTPEDKKSFAFVTYGDWDLLSMLPRQASVSNCSLPEYCQQWINLKKVYASFFGKFPHGMGYTLNALGLSHVGRHHSGIGLRYVPSSSLVFLI
nr:unnamed protein product [Spirometra erinaceieuropaei]